VRGRVGVIRDHYGAHVLPDRSAEGAEEARHLYNVRFEAAELWGEHAAGRSAVYVDTPHGQPVELSIAEKLVQPDH
jgi:nitrile hydratase